MKIPKDARRTARRLFHESFAEGVFDEARARAMVDALVREKPRRYLAILTVFLRLVRLEMARSTARVESATELDGGQRSGIEQRLRALYRRPLALEFRVNPSLIGGTRVMVGSDVWDGSVAGRLEELETAVE